MKYRKRLRSPGPELSLNSSGLWLRKWALALGSAAVFFGFLEGFAWLLGVPPAFHMEDPYSGFSRHVPHFVRVGETNGVDVLGVAPNKVRVLNPQTFQARKPAGVYRIVCVGGSSTYGRPFFDETSFPGWLRAMLPEIDPSKTWEVLNAGGISYASYRDVGLMEELSQYSPDLFVVYTGHNEFLERRTYAGLADRSPWVTSCLSLASRTRTSTIVRGVFDRLGVRRTATAHRAPVLGEDTKAIAVNAIGTEAYHRDDAFGREVVAHLRSTLQTMIRVAARAEAEILFVTPASNLADFVPFKSEHQAGLTPGQLAQWNRHFTQAQSEWTGGRFAEALAEIRKAEAIDDRFAAGWYWKGRILSSSGDFAGALDAFVRARDEDVCPLRAVSAIGDAVREAGRRAEKPVVDFDALIGGLSEHGLAGREFFHDHVHLSIEANRRMALAIVGQMEGLGIVCPGKVARDAALDRAKTRVMAGVDAERHAGELRQLAAMLGWLKQDDLARHQADLSLGLSGFTEEALVDLGARWRSVGRPELAVGFFRRGLLDRPDSAQLLIGLGLAELDSGRATDGIGTLERAIALQPENGEARTRLGMALALRGDWNAAEAHLREAVRLRPDSGAVRGNYGLVLARQGRFQEAIEFYGAALKLEPDLPSVHFNLGQAWEALGNPVEAAEHYQRALRIQPNHAQAQQRLAAVEQEALGTRHK
ncbi:MAG: tetratricopeptide repeat protein [Limisphaerales bacterium]